MTMQAMTEGGAPAMVSVPQKVKKPRKPRLFPMPPKNPKDPLDIQAIEGHAQIFEERLGDILDNGITYSMLRYWVQQIAPRFRM